MHNNNNGIRLALKLATLAFLLACLVVSLGAFTRLVHAGLGCPDWPGCYGHLTWPTSSADIARAHAAFPESPVDNDKTWPEMVHRYCAGTLGLFILAIVGVMVRHRHCRNIQNRQPPLKLAFLLLALVVIQAAFGMWTVTLKLWPQVVTAHLLGGFTTLSLLWLLRLRLLEFLQDKAQPSSDNPALAGLQKWFALLMLVVVVQISLGGWTSANYAAMACPDLPTCNGQWLPSTDFKNGFNFAQSIGPNYLGGTLDGPARTAIHLSHRLGAILVILVSIVALWRLARSQVLRPNVWLLSALLTTQVGLGLANVLFSLPLAVAVAHNGVGALLLLAVLTTYYQLGLITSTQQQKQFITPGGVRHEPVNQPAI